MIPRHVNPKGTDRTATAPYNFVPLPERVFVVADGIEVRGKNVKPWERQDRFVPGTHSGSIELTIETLTPLYIRGRLGQMQDGTWDDRDSGLRPDPYVTPDGRPAIPGSSLRGMVRTLVEILAFAKIQPVSRARPFFRDISPSRISTEYRNHFIENLGDLTEGIDNASGQRVSLRAPGYRARVRAGILNLGDRTIRECGFARIEQTLIDGPMLSGTGTMAPPSWRLQHSRIWVQADPREQDYFFSRKITRNGRQRHPDLYLRFRKVNSASRSEKPLHQRGLMVITGGIPNKHLEFVFLDHGDETAGTIEIPDVVWDRFHDENQITQWQEEAFPEDWPTKGCRKSKGHLRDGEPVFFLTDDNGGLVFLGRAQMFRFPYDLSPEDLVPDASRGASLDLAQAMFGYVGQTAGLSTEALKGRVFFEEAVATGRPPTSGWLEDILVPRILSAPKPTTFQHYLTQDGTQNARKLTTYLKGDYTTIRGHKLYWHRWDETKGLEAVREQAEHDRKKADLLAGREHEHKQHTIIRPVKAGVTFSGRIRFDNLTDIELGALLCALQLPAGCAHKLGMGKPLGLGSIRLEARLRLEDLVRRYESWEADGLIEADGAAFQKAFMSAIFTHAKDSHETLLEDRDGLRRIARLDALFQLLEWENRPAAQTTRFMVIEGSDSKRSSADTRGSEYRTRPVLPSPHHVAGLGEPSWQKDPPRPGRGSEGAPFAPPQQLRKPPARILPNPGDRVKAELLAQKTKKGGWRAKHVPTNIEGPIQNSSEVPKEKKAGDGIELVVSYANEREIAFRYPIDHGEDM